MADKQTQSVRQDSEAEEELSETGTEQAAENLETESAEPQEVEKVEEEAAPEAEPSAEEKPEEEELEIVEERFYDLNLRKVWSAPRESRVPRTINRVRQFVAERMKTDEVAISEELNGLVWRRGISHPPRKIKLRVVKDKEGRVIVFPAKVS